jgi:hypothetical protein
MLILKGNNGKSRVVSVISQNTTSVCIEYNNYPLFFNSICVDSTQFSLNDLIGCISEEIKDAIINDRHYDYLIVYTNQYESNLDSLIKWLDKHK